jgi:hypothetical protein
MPMCNTIPSNEITIISACWGDYWEKFGKEFIKSIGKLNHQPREVIISSEKILELPDGWNNLIVKKPFKWDAWNKAVKIATSKWILPVGIDDLFMPESLDSFKTKFKVIRFPYITNEGKLLVPNPAAYFQIEDINYYPVPGGLLIEKDVLIEYPIRNCHYSDWIHSLELFKNNIKVDFDFKARIIHRIHADQHSFNLNSNGIEEVKYFKGLIKNRMVKIYPGSEWPPKFKVLNFYSSIKFLRKLTYSMVRFLKKVG